MGIQLILLMTREVKLSSKEWALGITLEGNILVRAKHLGGSKDKPRVKPKLVTLSRRRPGFQGTANGKRSPDSRD